jgi:type I restriction enzyme M protein
LKKSGELKSPNLHLTQQFLLEHDLDERRLQTGDIILSTQGTLGKVGVIREPHGGGIPAHGITTIRLTNESVLIPYVVRLLQSGPYQQWLAAHSSGTTIKNLSARELKRLPIPVPKPEIQYVIGANAPLGADTTELLKSIVTGTRPDEAISFLLSDPAINDIVKAADEDPPDLIKFVHLADALRPWSSDTERWVAATDMEVALFLLTIAAVAESVTEAFDLPMGADRLAILNFQQSEIEAMKQLFLLTTNEIDGSVEVTPERESVRARVQAITKAIETVINNAKENILEQIDISAELSPAIVSSNIGLELTVQVKNNGSLPLRRFEFVTEPDTAFAKTSFLQVGDTLQTTMSVPPRPAGTYSLNVSWKASRLDGQAIKGEINLEYAARRAASQLTQAVGPNPYIAGSPLIGEGLKMFYGREDIIQRIKRSVRVRGSPTVLLLEGNRRTGKTSILNRLRVPNELPGWIPTYWTAQSGESPDPSLVGLTASEIFYQIARELVLAAQSYGYEFETLGIGNVSASVSRLELRKQLTAKLRPEFGAGAPLEKLAWQLEAIGEKLRDQRILLLLDEFDKIHEGIENGVTSPQVPENIRALLHTHPYVSAILSGSRRIKRLREHYWSALYGIGESVSVDALDEDAAMRLVTEPVEGRLVYSRDARDHVLEITNRQPYFIQGICKRIFDVCEESRQQNVTFKTVEVAAGHLIENNEHFRELFDSIGNNRRRSLTLSINRLAEMPDRVTFDSIADEVNRDGIDYDVNDLADDLKSLEENDVIALEQHESGNSYRIKFPLFARWLGHSIQDRVYSRLASEE